MLLQLWMTGLVKIEYGKEMQKLLTVGAFETIINILERYTAFSVQPIPMVGLLTEGHLETLPHCYVCFRSMLRN